MFSRGVAAELTTATGAAILAATVEGYGEIPAMRLEAIGYGAGWQRLDFPNLLRRHQVVRREVPVERGRYATKVERMQADARWAESAGLASVWVPQIPDEFDALTAEAVAKEAGFQVVFKNVAWDAGNGSAVVVPLIARSRLLGQVL